MTLQHAYEQRTDAYVVVHAQVKPHNKDRRKKESEQSYNKERTGALGYLDGNADEDRRESDTDRLREYGLAGARAGCGVRGFLQQDLRASWTKVQKRPPRIRVAEREGIAMVLGGLVSIAGRAVLSFWKLQISHHHSKVYLFVNECATKIVVRPPSFSIEGANVLLLAVLTFSPSFKDIFITVLARVQIA